MRWMVMLLIVVLFFVGCSKRGEEEATKGEKVRVPEVIQEETPEQKRIRLQREFEELRSYAERNPDDIAGIKARLKSFRGTEFEMKAERVLTDARGVFEQRAEESYRNLLERIKTKKKRLDEERLLPEDMADRYKECAAMVEEYPVAYRVTDWWKELQKVREEIDAEAKAASVWAEVRNRAVEEASGKRYKKAIEELEKFPKNYRESVWEEDRQSMLKEYKEALKKKEEEKKIEEKLKWEDIFTGQPLSKTKFVERETSPQWKVKDKVLVCETDGSTDAWLCTSKETKWRNFVLEMEFQFKTHGTFDICVHGTENKERPGWFGFDHITISSGDFEPGYKHSIRVRVRNKKVTVESTSLVRPLEHFCKREDGVFALMIPGGSPVKLEIYKMRIAFYPDK